MEEAGETEREREVRGEGQGKGIRTENQWGKKECGKVSRAERGGRRNGGKCAEK